MAVHDLKSKLNIETFNNKMEQVNSILDAKVDKGSLTKHEDYLDNEEITIPSDDILGRLNTVESNNAQFQKDLDIKLETNLNEYKEALNEKADKTILITSEPFLDNDAFEFEEDVIVRLNRIEREMVSSVDL